MGDVAKVIELVGTSKTGIEDAIEGAIARAAETVQNLEWFKVEEIRGAIEGGSIDRYQVILKVGFGLNDD
ncbi:dodecin [Novosphingobium sp. PS1R-30]|uniref:Dodecin n=1 Tax=Novosphingobium anseongense TaxID=3133436 RepID=A0ABU8RUK1_9SPHN